MPTSTMSSSSSSSSSSNMPPLPPSVSPPLPFTHPIHSRKPHRPSSSSSASSSSTLSLNPSPAHLPDPRQYHLRTTLNPFKWAKDESSGLFEYFTNEERYRMYTPDGYNLAHLQRQIARTFKSRAKPLPAEMLPGAEEAPHSEEERSRLNLLRWLASPSCHLFEECEDSVEVNDVELDELVKVAGSSADAGVSALKWLVKWSAEGRRYATWAELVDDVRDVQEGRELQPQAQVVAHRRRLEQQRREEALARMLNREKAERRAALRRKQLMREEEERVERGRDIFAQQSSAAGHSRRQSDSRTRLPAVAGRRERRGQSREGEGRGREGPRERQAAEPRGSAEEAKEAETGAESRSSGASSARRSQDSPGVTARSNATSKARPSRRSKQAAVD